MPALGLAPVGAAKTLVKHFRCYRLATNHVMLIFLKSGKNSCRLPHVGTTGWCKLLLHSIFLSNFQP